MPVYMIPNGKLPATVVTVAGDFKPGDPPPTGYNDWHEWAAVQTKSGLKQVRCGRCSLWKFPQELSGTVDKSVAYKTNRDAMNEANPVEVKSPVCLDCDQRTTN